MLKFSNEQAMALQQAFAPSAPPLVPPPSMQPSAHPPSTASPAPACDALCELSVAPRALLAAYIAFVLALALCDITSPRSMQGTATVGGPVLIIALTAHAALAPPFVSCMGLCCALLYPLLVLVASTPASWGFCAVVGLFFACSTPRSGVVRICAWACMGGIALTSGLLALGVRGRTLWGPVFTLLCIQAALTLWARGPLRLSWSANGA